MKIKYEGRSGRVCTEEELKEIYFSTHPNATELQFDFWLYFGIEQGSIKVIKA